MPTSRSSSRSALHSSLSAPSGATPKYSTYPVPDLIERWEHGKVTELQMIGHLLQHIADLTQRVHRLEQQAPSANRS